MGKITKKIPVLAFYLLNIVNRIYFFIIGLLTLKKTSIQNVNFLEK